MSGNPYIQRGWKDRQAKARDGMANRDSDRARVNAERQAYYAAQREEAAKVAAAEAEKRMASRCTCPACDGDGTVLITKAEVVLRALARLPSDSVVDGDVLGILSAIAAGEPVHSRFPLPLRNGAAHPRPATETDTAEEAEALAEVIAETKPKRRGR